MRATKFLTFLVSLAVQVYVQPMDWSHHFAYNNNDAVNSFLIDNYGNLLCLGEFANHGSLLFLTKEEIGSCTNHFNSIDIRGLRYCLNKKDGDVFVYKSDTIFIFKGGYYKEPAKKVFESQIKNVLSSVEIDDGTVLIGTFDNKLMLCKSDSFSPFEWPAGLNDHLLPCLYDSKKRIWAKTWNSGVFCYENKQWVKYDKSNSGLQSNKFGDDGTNIIEDKTGNIIAVSNDESNDSSGIFIFNGNSWKRKSIDPGQSYYNCIRCVAIDSSDAMWYGTLKGPVRIKNDSIYKYSMVDITKNGAPNGYVRDICVDKTNRVFFSTFHYGIYILDQNESFSCKKNPRIQITAPENGTQIHVKETMMIRWNSFGAGDTVLLQYKPKIGTNWLPCFPGNRVNQFFIRWILPDSLSIGEYSLRISDPQNLTTCDTLSFQIVGAGQNIPPQLQSIPDSISVNTNTTTTWTARATDSDKDTIAYQFDNLPTWITARDSVITISPTSSSARTTITVIVSDRKGGSDSTSIVVIPVPPVESSAKRNLPSNNIAIVTGKQNGIITVSEEFSRSVEYAKIFNCEGRLVANLEKSGNVLSFSVDTFVPGTGIYFCIVYGKDNKPVISRTVTFIR